MKNREDVKNFILKIEKDFPVNNLKVNDIHFWPLIRLELFFFIRKELFHEKKSGKVSKPKGFNISLTKRIKAYWKTGNESLKYRGFLKTIKKKDFLFVAHSNFRISYKGLFYNRFFDTLLSIQNVGNRSALLEMNLKKRDVIANPSIIIDNDRGMSYFKSNKKVAAKLKAKSNFDLQLNGYEDFIAFLNSNSITQKFSEKYTLEYVMSIAKEFSEKFEYYSDILLRVQPKKIFILCYYSDLAMVAAANKLKIETIEMQHGAQSSAHMAYGSWSIIPEDGYEMLPSKYWTWDLQSKNSMDEWIDKSKNYESFVGRNVWVDFWLKNEVNYKEKGFVLYTLQPDSLRMDELFPSQLIELIKLNKQKWYIRLHPRQLNKMDEIIIFLTDKGIIDYINLDNATKEPLPLLLSNCLVHITNSSASTIEASIFNKHTILLHEIGKLYYDELVQCKRASYLPVGDNFMERFDEIIMNLNKDAAERINVTFYEKYFSLN